MTQEMVSVTAAVAPAWREWGLAIDDAAAPVA